MKESSRQPDFERMEGGWEGRGICGKLAGVGRRGLNLKRLIA